MHVPPEWPGELRRRPPRGSRTYVVRAPLARWLESEARAARLRHADGFRVLDVGCGVKPYYPFFADAATQYVGIDVGENPAADLRGAVEELPVEDGSFDLVLCLQVLEHTEDPAQAVRELRRVVAPGGRVLASTHGVFVYHPAPLDLWRWTRAGLEHLFSTNADWSSLTVSPASGPAACVGMLVAIYLEAMTRHLRVAPLGRAFISTVNGVAEALDRPSRAFREPRPNAISANYHVTAVA